MSHDADDVVQRWILAFCETPPLIDLELMTRLLAEHEARTETRPQ
ncbi:hypothetical protein BH10PSE2_BH10PSE2_01500 [soil metagenome]